MPTPRPLMPAWHAALYGPSGFYRGATGPAGHFATSAQGLPGVDELLAECVVALCRHHDLHSIVEIACGRGELLTLVSELAPDLSLTAVDVVDRPAALPECITWHRSPGGAELPEQLIGLSRTLVLAHEWLDVVPCDIAVVTDDGLQVLGLADEALVPARRLTGPETDWCDEHWPDARAVVEIGLSRDRAYGRLRRRIADGLLVCVDYGHVKQDRPHEGTFVGYRDGTICAAQFDGSTDLTAHVAMDSLGADRLVRQRDLARELVPVPAPPEHSLAAQDPPAYLAALRRRSAWSTFTAPTGLGAFWWSLETITSSGAVS